MPPVARDSNNRFERYPRLTILVLVLLFAAVVDVGIGSFWPVDQGGGYRVSVVPYHHGLAPMMDVPQDRWGPLRYEVHTNSLGFKDVSARPIAMRPEGERFVFIGDSFTEGIGVPWEQTFVGMIAAHLDDSGIEVLNAAVASYSPIIYERKIRYLIDRGFRFDRLFVFVDLSDAQDELLYEPDESGDIINDLESPERLLWEEGNRRIELATRGANGFRRRRWLTTLGSYSVTARALANLAERALAPESRERAEALWRLELTDRRTLWPLDGRLRREYADSGNARARANMSALARLARRYGFDLTVAVYPRRVQIFYDDAESLQVLFWRDWAAEEETGFINLFPCFFRDLDKDVTLHSLFIPEDAHWNAKGHAVVANAFLSWYERGDACPLPASVSSSEDRVDERR